MDISFVAATTFGYAASGTAESITLPSAAGGQADIALGDLILIIEGHGNAATYTNVLAGYTAGPTTVNGTAYTCGTFWKISDGTDSGTAFTMTLSSTSTRELIAFVVRGVSAPDSINATTTAASVSQTAPAAINSGLPGVVLALGGGRGAADGSTVTVSTFPAGYTNTQQVTSTLTGTNRNTGVSASMLLMTGSSAAAATTTWAQSVTGGSITLFLPALSVPRPAFHTPSSFFLSGGPNWRWPTQSAASAGPQSLPRSLTDSVTISDGLVTNVVTSRALTDSVTISDSIARTVVDSRALSDSVVISDSLARSALTITRAATDSVAISDVLARTVVNARNVSDTVTISDALARSSLTLTRTVADSAVISELITNSGVTPRALFDTVSISDSLARSASTLTRTVSDTITISDAVARGFPRTSADSVVISDTIGIGTLVRTRTTADTVSISDAIASPAVHSRALADIVSISDALARTTVLTRLPTDTVSINDVITRTVIDVRSISDVVTINDALTSHSVISRNITDSVSISDITQNGTQIRTRAIADGVSITDLIVSIRPATITDAVLISDSVHISSTAYTRTGIDSVSILDGIHSTSVKVATSVSGSWWHLDFVIRAQAEEANYYRMQEPVACPKCGQPLLTGPPQYHAVKYCPWGHFEYPRDWDMDTMSGM